MAGGTLSFYFYSLCYFLSSHFGGRNIPPCCRYMLGLSIVPAVLQFFGFFFLPESPRWLLQKGRSQEAREVLSWIRGRSNVDEEYETIRSSIEEEEQESGEGERLVDDL